MDRKQVKPPLGALLASRSNDAALLLGLRDSPTADALIQAETGDDDRAQIASAGTVGERHAAHAANPGDPAGHAAVTANGAATPAASAAGGIGHARPHAIHIPLHTAADDFPASNGALSVLAPSGLRFDSFLAGSGVGLTPTQATPDLSSGGRTPADPGAPAPADTLAPGTTVQSQTVTFTSGPESFTGGSDGFTFALPSELYQSFGKTLTLSAYGFTLSGFANIEAGIKGSVSIGLGSYTPEYPVNIDPNAPPDAVDGTVFAVDPTLISTSDASFSLSLANAMASLEFGLQAAAGISLGFPSVQIGFSTPFGFAGFTIGGGSISEGFSVGSFTSLKSGTTVSVPGGSLTLSEIGSSTISSGSTSALAGLPSISLSAQTAPFLNGTVDLVALLAKYVPELAAVSGSYNEGPISASYDLLSLPLSVSLSLGENITLTPLGIDVTVTDPQNHESKSGTLGSIFQFDAPSSGSGTIPLSVSYTLLLDVSSSIGLDGTVALGIGGPQASLSILGFGGTIGPLFSANIFNIGGQIASIDSWNFEQSLTGTSTVDVNYVGTSTVETVSTSTTGINLTSTGAVLDITASGSITGASYGVQDLTSSEGQIFSAGGITAHKNGIYLKSGGIVRNQAGGRITHAGSTASYTGIDLKSGLSSVAYNDGTVSGFVTGIYLKGGNVTNAAAGQITAKQTGITLAASDAAVVNDGTITAATGINLSGGGSAYNAAGGVITASLTGISAGGTVAGVVNRGVIRGASYGVTLSAGGTVTNEAGGSIIASAGIGVRLSGGAVVLENAGTITGSARAVYLGGTSNTLIVDAGAVFNGTVSAAAGAGGVIDLSPGTGTLAGLGTAFTGFTGVDVSAGGSWTIAGSLTALEAVTIAGLSSTDHIDITGTALAAGEVTRVNLAANTVSLYSVQRSGGYAYQLVGTVQLGGAPPTGAFTLSSDGAGGTVLTELNTQSARIAGANTGVTLSATSLYGPDVSVGALSSINMANAVTQTAYGIHAVGELARITNYGYIAGTSVGVDLSQGGTISNFGGYNAPGSYASAVIFATGNTTAAGYSAERAVSIGQGGGTVINAGSISGNKYGTGIYAADGAIIRNDAASGPAGVGAGSISGGYGIDIAGAAGTLTNAGLVLGGKTAVLLQDGGHILNTGTISVGNAGAPGNYGSAVLITGAAGVVGNIEGSILGGARSGYGVKLVYGGSVYNIGGTITSGGAYAVIIDDGGNFTNGGTIGGSASGGVEISGGGTVTNLAFSTITSPYYFGVNISSGTSPAAASYVSNGRDSYINGVMATNPAIIYNKMYATIGGTGVNLVNGVGTAGVVSLTNQGTIDGRGLFGQPRAAIVISTGATITNGSYGLIKGTYYAGDGIAAHGNYAVTVNNSGTIQASGIGVLLGNGGTLTNAKGASIGGGAVGVSMSGTAAVLENDGTIAGTTAAVQLEGAASNLLTIGASAVFTGGIQVNASASNTLGLDGANGPGTLTGTQLHGAYAGFGDILVDSGASWTATNLGGLSASSVLTVDGTLSLAGSVSFATAGYGQNASGGIIVSGGQLTNSAVITGGAGGYTRVYRAPGGDGAVGVTLNGGVLANTGSIFGGAGGGAGYVRVGGTGGAGVTQYAGSASNTGTIGGGAGGAYLGGDGGVGVNLAGGSFTNAAVITGGAGGYTRFFPDFYYPRGAYGGAGVSISGGVFTNTGHITGGTAGGVNYRFALNSYTGYVYSDPLGGYGGAGVLISGGTLVTSGTITAGGAGHNSLAAKDAVQFTGAGTLEIEAGAVFNGLVAADAGAYDVLALGGTVHGTLTGLGSEFTGFSGLTESAGVTWTVSGSNTFTGAASIAGTLGIAGTLSLGGAVSVGGRLNVTGVLNNGATIAAAAPSYKPGLSGHAGVYLVSGALSNSGSIFGGYGCVSGSGAGGNGGAGVVVTGGKLSNTGLIEGSRGAYSTVLFGNGGAGVTLGAKATLNNAGQIIGGGGGYTYRAGAGVTVAAGAVLTNTGTIDGGSGGYHGGAGVYLTGGTLITSGAIVGGSGADAVQFAAGATGLLEIGAGARFTGAVAGNAADTLQLLAGGAGTLSGLGSAFSGFGTLTEVAGANWALTGANSFAGAASVNGTLALAGTLSGAGILSIGSGGLLDGSGTLGLAVVNGGIIDATAGTLAISGAIGGAGKLEVAKGAELLLSGGGTLTEAVSGAGTLALDAGFTLGTAPLTAGEILIQAGGSLAGAGTLTQNFVNLGEISAAGGTLTLHTAITGGTLAAASGATLVVANAGKFTGTLAGAGAILIDAVLTLGNGTVLAGANIQDTAQIKLASGAKVTESAGATLTVDTLATATISISGGAGFNNSGYLDESGAGTVAVSTGFTNHGHATVSGGTMSFLGAVTNYGTISAGSGVVNFAKTVSGNGTLQASSGGTLDLSLGAAASQVLSFAGGGVAELGTPLDFLGSVKGFASGCVIELLHTTETSYSFTNSVLQIDNGTQVVADIHFAGSYSLANFAISAQGSTTVVGYQAG